MVKFINALTGNIMYVDENRKEEYLKLGHRLAEDAPTFEKKVRAKRTTSKK